MKKIINIAFFYAILGLVAGVFTREFNRFVGYTGDSMLSVLHTHLLILGMMFMLIVALFYKQYDFSEDKKFKMFFIMYNTALPLVVIMMLIRGITQVLGLELTRAVDFTISGIAGLSHILMAGAIIHFFLAVKDKVK
jgi:nitric oxide reductase large subunit